MTDAGDSNGKITMALIGQKLDDIIRRLDRMESNFHEMEKRVNVLELGQIERQTQIRSMCSDIQNLEKKSESWSMINTLGAIVAGILGAIGISK